MGNFLVNLFYATFLLHTKQLSIPLYKLLWLLPSIEALMQVVKIVAFHFNAKKEDFFKVLDAENSESSDDVLIALIECCKAKLTLVQDNIGEDEEDEADLDACKTIGGK